jgi:thioredoxin reductase (NADPH)
MEEANFLSRFADSVTVIHRRDEMRASKIMTDRARANPKIRWLLNSVVEDIVGDQIVEGVAVRDLKSGEVTTHPFTGVFVAIGHRPNTDLFAGQLDLLDNGYLVTRADRSQTSVEGVFACGDVQDDWYRQAITAAGSGCMAAIDAERWLEEQGH